MSLQEYKERFSSLKMHPLGGGRRSPHKVALLLAVIDLIESGQISENKIYFDEKLKKKFKEQLKLLSSAQIRNRPQYPFFHLRSSKFWHHEIKDGRQTDYESLTTVTSARDITENIEYAHLDEELFGYLGGVIGRAALRLALLYNFAQDDVSVVLSEGDSWNWLECEAVVSHYFNMLDREVAGKPGNEDQHFDLLKLKLVNRNRNSIIEKCRHISAILAEMRQHHVQAYNPLQVHDNPQLKRIVVEHLAARWDIVVNGGEMDVPPQIPGDWSKAVVLEDAPFSENNVMAEEEPGTEYRARQVDFAERDRRNRRLGEWGERFVLEYERYRVQKEGSTDLAHKVEWVSKTEGDGLGYDIRSFDLKNGNKLYIEVKTTRSTDKGSPFFISDKEVSFSEDKAQQYQLSRLYNFLKRPKMFQLKGDVSDHVSLMCTGYKASFRR